MNRSLPPRLDRARYEIRGRLQAAADRLEAQGRPVLRLDLGNPGAFGFRAPSPVVEAVAAQLERAQEYSPSRGLAATCGSVARYAWAKGIPVVDERDVYLGNGVSELVMMSLQALVADGDEVLVPMPHYPLWAAAAHLAGGVAVHYPCVEAAGWLPDPDALDALVTPHTRALVVINPNNPTGAVYPLATLTAIAEVARRHGLVVLADEIYDQILYDAEHLSLAALAPDVPCLTFNGLSKAYLLAGYRSGWLTITGPARQTAAIRLGLDRLAAMRLCPNVPGQCAAQVALDGAHGPQALLLPRGRLRVQRDAAHAAFCAVPGVSAVPPSGGLYCFLRLDPQLFPCADDEQLALDLLLGHSVLFSPGSTFGWQRSDHLRVVTLADRHQLHTAAGHLRRFAERSRRGDDLAHAA